MSSVSQSAAFPALRNADPSRTHTLTKEARVGHFALISACRTHCANSPIPQQLALYSQTYGDTYVDILSDKHMAVYAQTCRC